MKNCIKKIGAGWLAILLLALSACGAPAGTESGTSQESAGASGAGSEAAASSLAKDSEASAKESTTMYKIGVVQLAPHNALDDAYQGFLEGLRARGYEEGKNLALDYNNALGDASNVTTVAQKVVHNEPDLIFAIATPAAQAVANLTKEIPIVITAVTDPVAAGLVPSGGGGNVTGTSDLTPVAEQFALLQTLLPEAKRIGILTNSSEDNSRVQVEMAKEAAQAAGLQLMEYTISKSDELVSVTQSMVGKIDALYVPTDNLVSENLLAVTGVTTPAKIPVICGEEAMLERGGLATKGINYFELGKQAGDMAADILEGADPASLPIGYQKDLTIRINEEVAGELGISVPDTLR